MLACQANLVKFDEEARSRKPPVSPSLETMFNVWRSIVKKFNYNQKQKAQERRFRLKGALRDGGFSMAFVRNLAESLGLRHAAIGSTEPQDAELEPMETSAQEVVDIITQRQQN